MATNAHVILQQILEDQMGELEINTTINDFFRTFSALQILKNSELSYEEIAFGNVDGSHDGGIDNLYLFINGDIIDWRCFFNPEEEVELDNPESLLTLKSIKEKYKKNIEIELVIIQSKLSNSFSESPVNTLKTTLTNLLNFEKNIFEYESRYKIDLLNAFNVFRQIFLVLIPRRCEVKVNIYYTSKGSDIHPNVIAQSKELESIIENKLTNSKANFEFFGAQKLIDLYQKIPDTNFDLNLVENCISNNTSSFIGLVNIKELYNFITDGEEKLIKHIFESNVRDYQG